MANFEGSPQTPEALGLIAEAAAAHGDGEGAELVGDEVDNSPGVRGQAKRDTALFADDNERSEAAAGSRSSHAKTPRPKDTRVQPWGLWVLA